jgi:2-polyprenyl-3-methyl-5-hydroxy-6-metoxy-1,4-benzoquinol methylase
VINKVKEFYNQSAEHEWGRLDRNPHEFELTKRMISKYIKPGDKVLDIGGGPGRYSLWLAAQDCEVTLIDLAPENVKFAESKATELKLKINAIAGNALEADKLVSGEFDHVLVMGPLYHLLDETDRVTAMNAALKLLKPGGYVYASFISLFSNALNQLMNAPEMIADEMESLYFEKLIADESFAYYGDNGFTAAYFIRPSEIPEFMRRFPLEQKHLFAQEGILNPFDKMLLEQSEEISSKWYDLAEKLCERPEFLGYSEHLMYIGKKLER